MLSLFWPTLYCVQCKHVLAAKLSAAMQLHGVQNVSDEHISALLNAINWLIVSINALLFFCDSIRCSLSPQNCILVSVGDKT